MSAVAQPSGTVTLVFTDIEGSTRLLEELGVDAYREALAEHRRVVREACSHHHGYEVDYEGDAFFYAFASAQAAVSAVSDAMVGLQAGPIRIRVGVHTGEPGLDPPKYVGMDVHLAARVMSSAHGGQVVLSPSTVSGLEPESFELRDLGEHRFKDIEAAIPIFQLGDGSFPPLKTISNTNLPRPASSFVGRERELAEVLARVEQGARLVTLTGPGGSGKTRLALEAAATLVPEFKAGVFWVGLAALRDPALVIETIAQTLGAKDDLAGHIAERELLLLLDNLEQVIEVAPELSALLQGCPNLTLLVTSRELLRIDGEVEYQVPPLAEPEAIALFCERAQTEPSYEIRELCARLDNLPLAVELAAARTKVLSPAQILERLSQRLDLLKGGRDADPRQHTLRATIEWSYHLLTEHEQRLFRTLSVFAGGCTLAAAEAVAAADLDTLQALVEKSLLRFSNERYWMLETIREHASDALRLADEVAEVFERFDGWLDELVGEVDRYWVDRDQLEWFDRLEAERANLMHGISERRERARDDDAVRLIVAAVEFFDARGPWEAIAAILHDSEPSSEGLAARARFVRGLLLHRLERFTEAIAEYSEAQRRATATDDDAHAAKAQAFVAGLAVFGGKAEVEAPLTLAHDAVARARRSGDPSALAQATNTLGIVVSTMGDNEYARALFSDATRLAQEIGDQRNAALFGLNLIGENLARRQVEDAAKGAQRAIPVMRRLGDNMLEAGALGLLSIASVAAGDLEAARSAVAEMLEAMRDHPEEALVCEALFVLAMAAAATEPHASVAVWAAAEGLRIALSSLVSPELRPYVEEFLEPRRRPDFELHWQRGETLTVDDEMGLRV